MKKRRSKVYKIKHYKSNYNRYRKKGKLRTFLLIFACIAVFGVSFAFLGPLSEWVYNLLQQKDNISESSHHNEDSNQSEENSGSASQEKSDDSQISLWFASDDIKKPEGYDTMVERAKNAGATSVVFPVREGGSVFFPSSNEMALASKSVFAYPLDELIRKFKNEGIKITLSFSCFDDRIVPYYVRQKPELSEMAVLFRSNTQFLWLNHVGGQPFLNPASGKTQQYLKSLLEEAAALSPDAIMLTEFAFPTSVDNDLNALFTGLEQKPRNEMLTEIFTEFKDVLPENVKLLVKLEEDALTVDEGPAFGTNPLTLGFGAVCVNASSKNPEEPAVSFSTISGKFSGKPPVEIFIILQYSENKVSAFSEAAKKEGFGGIILH